jgi:exopolyphosphatase/guanosine-5'-triphosphate,3'-diphosphate pyrophosphatase
MDSTPAPRWEWRTFGDRFGEVESTLSALAPEQVQETTELYLLSESDTDVVKVRHELMDIKHLQQVDVDGLERWAPTMKAAFPLSPAEVAAVARALGVDAPASSGRTEHSLTSLLEELVGPNPNLHAVEVHKKRNRYTIGGCMAELTEVRTERASTRTVAVESEDATRVTAAVRGAGLAARPNVSFVRGLKTLVRVGVDRFAVVDVGTNSVKFCIGERSAHGDWVKLVDRAEITRLGDGIQESGRLRPEPMARTVEAIAGMAEEARQHRVAGIAAVGTAGLRMASNGVDFVDAVLTRCGIDLEIISGEEEGRLAYRAATATLPVQGSRVVFDTGGGSTQFTFGQGVRVDERFSVPVGAVRFTEQYDLSGVVSVEVLTAAVNAIEAGLDRLDSRVPPETLVGMGGALSNLAAVKHGLAVYDPDTVHGTVLDRGEIDRQIELYRTRALDDRRTVVGLQPQRADIILAGACIVRTVLDKLGKDSLTVSDRGLRHGVLVERTGWESRT